MLWGIQSTPSVKGREQARPPSILSASARAKSSSDFLGEPAAAGHDGLGLEQIGAALLALAEDTRRSERAGAIQATVSATALPAGSASAKVPGATV